MDERAIRLQAAIARATIRAMGYHAENMQRQACGKSMAYDEAAFEAIIADEGIGFNDAIEMTR